jgi:hypothetical protein
MPSPSVSLFERALSLISVAFHKPIEGVHGANLREHYFHELWQKLSYLFKGKFRNYSSLIHH